MFYSEHVLAKKGPLGKIWLAAHWEKKLTKTNIMQTDIPSAVSQVQAPEAPMALRLSGQLLLGVVRIYSRKAKYLLDDCDEAITKIKIAFVPGAVDLAPELAQASYHSITLPENLANVDILLPDANLDFQFLPGQLQFPDAETSMMEVDFSLRRGLDFTGDFGVEPSVEQGREAPQVSDFGVDFSVDTSKGNQTEIGDFGVDRFDYGDHGDHGYQGDQGKEGPSFTFGDDSIMFAPQETAPEEVPAKQAVQRNRKRKLVIDEHLEIPTAEIKDQIADFSSLIREQTFLPTSKRVALEEHTVERSTETMFSLPPTISDLSDELQAFISHNLVAPEVEPPAEEIEELRAHVPDHEIGDTTTVSEYPNDEPYREEPYQEEPHHVELRGEDERPQFQVGEKDQGEFPEEEEEVPEEAEPTAATGGLSNQTLSVIDFLKTEFEEKGRDEVLNTQDLLAGKTKKSVASTFFEILVLRTRGYLDVKQDEPYGNIELTARETLFQG